MRRQLRRLTNRPCRGRRPAALTFFLCEEREWRNKGGVASPGDDTVADTVAAAMEVMRALKVAIDFIEFPPWVRSGCAARPTRRRGPRSTVRIRPCCSDQRPHQCDLFICGGQTDLRQPAPLPLHAGLPQSARASGRDRLRDRAREPRGPLPGTRSTARQAPRRCICAAAFSGRSWIRPSAASMRSR